MKFRWKASLAAMAALAIGMSAVVSAQPSRPHPPKPPFPQVELPQKARGERAVQLLGARLPEVAAWYGKSPGEFASILRRDGLAWIDRQGRLLYEEEIDPPSGNVGSLTSTGALASLDQTFRLHSKPGAKRTIYLNFVGATLTGTAWNTSSQPTITAAPFDLDGVPYSFSTAELQRVQYVWQRVAEDFAPFDVDVTTEPPPADALARSGSGDDTFGTTVLVTKRTFYSCSCGGVAYVGAFDDTSNVYKPALVFYDALGGNEKNIAEAASHEAGHNLGLHHDGTSSASYYTGHGEGATGWAPIMGVGYSKALVQWSRGEYPGANNREDDFTVMAAYGLPLRGDDHGNTAGTATRLAGATANGVTTVAGAGIVERASDVDVFSFVAGPGALNVAVTPAARSGNVDLAVELLDGGGSVLAASNPVDALNGTLAATTATGGTFFVAIRGTGKGDLTSGYSSYGSVGEYAVTGTVPAPASQPPVAVMALAPSSGTAPLPVSFSAAGSYDPEGQPVAIEWTFGDGSAMATGATASHTYAAAGTYTATLRVTDAAGLTSIKNATVSVTSTPPVSNGGTMSVAGIAVTLVTNKGGQTQATARVEIRDGSGNAVGGATVTGTWSGAISGSGSGTTGSSGVASITSSRSKATGTYTFTVTGVALAGYTYVPANNVETSDGKTR